MLNLGTLTKSRHTTLTGILLMALMAADVAAQSGTMRGFADIHNHEFANMAFGGYAVAGKAFGPMQDALSEAQCRAGHSSWHKLDILGAQLAGYLYLPYSNDGYPNFSGWPAFFEVSHQKVHEEFLYRAVQGGLRLMVMMAVESPIFCEAVSNGGGKTDGRNCSDEMTSILKQIDAAYAMQDYIDTEAGGRGLGWYRIVTTPTQARKVIQAGKLAVVLGVETSHLFNCYKEPCNWSSQLDDLWNRGVRHFFPLHHDKNAFGGPSYFQSTIQNGVPLLGVNPYTFPTISCGYTFPNTHLNRGGGRCDELGLTLTGKALIDKLMSLGALIDVDHMSDRSFADTLDLAEKANYPIVASHTGFNAVQQRTQDHEGQLTQEELARIQRVGGMIGLISSPGDIYTVGTYKRNGLTIQHNCGRSSETFVQPYLYALDHAPGMSIAIGTDFNGPLRQLGPRFGANACNGGTGSGTRSATRLPTDFLARGSNTKLTPFTTGHRTWDFNQDGLAHVGLLPDVLADLEVLGIPPSDLEPLFNSAEGYVETWERAAAHVYEFTYSIGTNQWSNKDLTGSDPDATLTPRATALTSLSNAKQDIVFYVGQDQHVRLFLHNRGAAQWDDQDLSGSFGGGVLAAPGTKLTSYTNAIGQISVAYVGSNQHVYNFLYNPGGTRWYNQDLTGAFGNGVIPSRGTALTSFVHKNQSLHIFYIGLNQHVYEFLYNPGGTQWYNQDLSGSFGGGVLAASGSSLASYVKSNQQVHLDYIGTDQHVYEFLYNPGGTQWYNYDLSGDFGERVIASVKGGLAATVGSNQSQHVFYISPSM